MCLLVGRLGHVGEQVIQQLGDPDSMFGRQRIELVLSQAIEIGDERIGFRRIDLVDHKKDGFVCPAQRPHDFFIRRGESCPGIEDEDQNIRLGNGELGLLPDQIQHALVGRGIKSSGIDQAKLPITIGAVGIVAISGHARHIVDDRRARAENPLNRVDLPTLGDR